MPMVFTKSYKDMTDKELVDLIIAGNEEADLREKCAIVNTGVAITQIKDEHPVNLNTFASEIVLPSFERMDDIAVLKVTA